MNLRRLSQTSSGRALIGTGIGSLPGFILPFALVWHLHGGRLTDAYFLGLAIAMFVANVLGGVLEVNVLPAVEACKRAGSDRLEEFLRRTIRNALAIAGLTYVPTGLVGVLIVSTRHSWTSSQKQLCMVLIAIFGLYIAATAITSVLDGTLYALGSFFVPTLSQCIRSLLPLAFLVVTPRDAAGVIFTASLLVAGEFIRGGLLINLVRTRIGTIVGDGSQPQKSRLLAASLPHALSVIVVSASPLVDKVIASPLGPGSVTLIELGEKVFFVPFLAISSSVVLVAGARWARLSHDDPSSLARDFSRTLRHVIAISFAAALLIGGFITAFTVVYGQSFIGLSASQFRLIVLIFLAGLPGAMIINQGARLMTALQRTRILPFFAVTAFVVNIVGDLVGAHYLGIEGIALASTGFRYVNAILYLWVCTLLLRAATAQASGFRSPTPFFLR